MLVIGLLVVGVSHRVRTVERTVQDAPQSPSEVARLLVDHGTAVQVSAKGKVKHTIENEAPTFVLPSGPTRVVLFKLPEYRTPYVIAVKSVVYGFSLKGLKYGLFVPNAIMFDDGFQQTREWAASEFVGVQMALQVRIAVGEEQKASRYLLLYTSADAVGEPIRVRGTAGAELQEMLTRVRGSETGRIDVETK
jgi:hypothetical protein